MKMKKALQILCVLQFLTSSFTYGQSVLNYHVLKDGKHVGEMRTQIFQEGNQTKYLLDYDLTITFLFSVKIGFSLECIYEKGKLIHATTISKRDGKIREKTVMDREGDYYKLITDGHLSLKEVPMQYFSTTSLYFEEPIGRRKVFSERFGELLLLRKMSDGRYEMTLKGGNKNYYTYQNGVCTLMTVSHTLGDVDFQLISN